MARRRFIRGLGAGVSFAAFGGVYTLADDGLFAAARAETRPDGRPRLPPGQRLITALRPMGGERGEPSKSKFRLRVHGEVATPLDLDFRALLGLPQVTQRSDVHCVTGWSVFDAEWTGVRISEIAKAAGVTKRARHVIFEGAHGYTANVTLKEALADPVMVAHKLDGKPLAIEHGAPARAVMPDLYFWKSSKWLTGIQFVARDAPGYWEVRGYHNHADPWREERYS